MAIGWATVELERAERELAGTLAIGSRGAFRSGLADGILGAACRMVRPDPGGPWLVLLEPTTEGRLAATLARSGEGVAAVYVARAPGDEGASAVEPGLPGLPSPASGPFGVSRLLAGGRHGPYLILVEPGPDLE